MDLERSDNPWVKFVLRRALRKLLDAGWFDTFATSGLAVPDEVHPPPGWDTWDLYAIAKELAMTDFLPLGEPAPEGAKLSAVFARTGEDVAVIGMHFVHANPDILGDTLPFTDDECAAIEARFDTLWAALRPYYASTIDLARYEWHNFGVGIRRPNPKRLETVMLAPLAGTADPDELPPQVAMSVTFKTDHRKTWGRVYMPAPNVGVVHLGRIATAMVDVLRTAFGTLLDGVAADHTPLVVWSPRRNGGPLEYGVAHHAADDDMPDTTSFAKSVAQVQVDDLFDVIRSRRFDVATLKDTHTLGA